MTQANVHTEDHAFRAGLISVLEDSPGKDKEANWLPAAHGPIYMVMRLYWPKYTAPSIVPPVSGTWNPPVVTQVQ